MPKLTDSSRRTLFVVKTDRGQRIITQSSLEIRTCACGCGRTWRSFPTSKWNYASTQCAIADGRGGDVKYQSQHWEYNGTAMTAEKVLQSQMKQKKRGKKPCKHHVKNL